MKISGQVTFFFFDWLDFKYTMLILNFEVWTANIETKRTANLTFHDFLKRILYTCLVNDKELKKTLNNSKRGPAFVGRWSLLPARCLFDFLFLVRWPRGIHRKLLSVSWVLILAVPSYLCLVPPLRSINAVGWIWYLFWILICLLSPSIYLFIFNFLASKFNKVLFQIIFNICSIFVQTQPC